MQAPNWFILSFIYFAFFGCSISTASLENAAQEDTSTGMSNMPSRGAILEAFLNYLFSRYPSSDMMSTLRWDSSPTDPSEFTQGTPKRLYYAPRAGKRSGISHEDNELTKEEMMKSTNGGTRWKRSVQETEDEEDEENRNKRETSKTDANSEEDFDSNDWWWSKVRRSPFSPRLGKRHDDVHYNTLYDDDDIVDMEDLNDDDSLEDNLMVDTVTQEHQDAVAPRLMIRSALVPRLGKKNFAFSPRLGKRGSTFIPRLGKRADFAFSPRLGKRGDFAFSPRLGKKADFAFSPRLGKRGDFAFSPRLGKKADFAFSPRLGKRGDFAFSPRLGKKADFAFSPRLGKRGASFIPRLGKRESETPTPVEMLRTEPDEYLHLQQRSMPFSPRLG